MEERKKPERGDTGAREQREKDELARRETEDRELRRANIAGEEYVQPKEASPAYAPRDETTKMNRANVAGESYESPAKKPELHPPGKKR